MPICRQERLSDNWTSDDLKAYVADTEVKKTKMDSHLRDGHIHVGIKQSKRDLQEGNVIKAYVAEDADPHVTDAFVAQCAASGVEVVYVESMHRLGREAGIERAAAVVVELRN